MGTLMTHLVKIIQCEPGIDKDSTSFSTKSYIDGEHLRFYGKEGRPFKIRGYKLIDETNEIVRTLNMIERTGGGVDIYYGSASSLLLEILQAKEFLEIILIELPLDLYLM